MPGPDRGDDHSGNPAFESIDSARVQPLECMRMSAPKVWGACNARYVEVVSTSGSYGRRDVGEKDVWVTDAGLVLLCRYFGGGRTEDKSFTACPNEEITLAMRSAKFEVASKLYSNLRITSSSSALARIFCRQHAILGLAERRHGRPRARGHDGPRVSGRRQDHSLR